MNLQLTTTTHKYSQKIPLYNSRQLATTGVMEPRSAPARPLWDRIQAVCAVRGWSTVRLERETGVSRTTIAKWKTQPRTPQAATVNTVARVLDIEQVEALRLAGILAPGTPEPEQTSVDDDLAALLDEARDDPELYETLMDVRRDRKKRKERATEDEDGSEEVTG